MSFMSKDSQCQSKLYMIRSNPKAALQYSEIDLRELTSYIISSLQNRKQFSKENYHIYDAINIKNHEQEKILDQRQKQLAQIKAKALRSITSNQSTDKRKQQVSQIVATKKQETQISKQKPQGSISQSRKWGLHSVIRLLSKPLYYIQKLEGKQKKDQQHQSSQLKEEEFEEQQPFLYQKPTGKETNKSSAQLKFD